MVKVKSIIVVLLRCIKKLSIIMNIYSIFMYLLGWRLNRLKRLIYSEFKIVWKIDWVIFLCKIIFEIKIIVGIDIIFKSLVENLLFFINFIICFLKFLFLLLLKMLFNKFIKDMYYIEIVIINYLVFEVWKNICNKYII